MRFWTASGSEYEMAPSVDSPDETLIRRVNDKFGKRGDSEWQALLAKPDIEIGSPAQIHMMTLGDSGIEVVMRTTSKVVGFEVERP